jgi:UDP-N-acetylglucosamine 2-epimerase (non-hydrolysing)
MKILIVVGARPNFMKAAPLIAAIREHNKKLPAGAEKIEAILVHTGQHYDSAMSDSFFADLELPKPDMHLGIGSGSHAVQTAEIMRRFEEVLLQEKPEAMIVVGDVNSTLACALVASKISMDSKGTRPLIAHVEAGLRSFDREMPEEINRVLTDHISDLLFVTEESGIQNLRREGVADEKVHFVGNTMIDSLLAFQNKADKSNILADLGLTTLSRGQGASDGASRYALLTLHRPSNVDNRDTFLNILEGIEELSRSCPIVFSAHPRTKKRITEFGLEHFFEFGDEPQSGASKDSNEHAKRIRLLDPLGYIDFLCLMKHASIVITDSGGIQEETTCLGVPCVTVRENTERPVTLTCGTNTIAGTRSENIREAIKAKGGKRMNARVPEKWDGMAGTRIVKVIVSELLKKRPEQVVHLR